MLICHASDRGLPTPTFATADPCLSDQIEAAIQDAKEFVWG